jgi:hypothetical protein
MVRKNLRVRSYNKERKKEERTGIKTIQMKLETKNISDAILGYKTY